MPVLQYRCPSCGKEFEELVKHCEEEVKCPACNAVAEREWAGKVYSATGKPAKNCSGHCATCGGCK